VTEKTADSTRAECFTYQMELLKLELETINEVIARIDGTTQAVKNWAVVVWAGSIAIALDKDLRTYVGFTAALPLLFWFVDAWWRRIQRHFIFRSHRIADFLNSPDLYESFEKKALVGFRLWDPKGVQYKHQAEARAFFSVFRTLRFRDVGAFYLGLSVLSLIVGWLTA
jgi:hypothetical protein